MRVRIDQVCKRFGSTPALHDVSLEVASGELFFLLGPSGCGKTTLLRTLAGFYQPDSGELFFGDRRMKGVPPHDRRCGMVFQNYALWPHLNVRQNVAYGLEVQGVGSDEMKRRVGEALSITRMEAYSDRNPNQLSGGQQQRVALARALVVRPDLLLLDEPLSNLDAQLRLELRHEIRRIHRETRITTVYVTHDQKEALSMADRMAILREGRLEQVGDPRSVYRAPCSRFVAEFVGEVNWLKGRVLESTSATCRVETCLGVWEAVPQPLIRGSAAVLLGFRPESVEWGEGLPNAFPAEVLDVSYLGDTEQYLLRVPSGLEIKALEHNPVLARAPGAKLSSGVRPHHLIVLADPGSP